MTYDNNQHSFIVNAFENIYGTRFRFEKGPIRLLCVESVRSDGVTYRKILKEPVIIEDKPVSCAINEDCIFDPNVLLSSSRGVEAVDLGNYYNRKKPLTVGWKGVIDIVDCIQKTAYRFSKFQVFGFIDRDTEGPHPHPISGKPISMTEMHDCETNILRTCFNKYCEKLTYRDDVVKAMGVVLDFSFVQGTLEKLSFDYYSSSISELLKEITHNSFKNDVVTLYKEAKDNVRKWFSSYLRERTSMIPSYLDNEYFDFIDDFEDELDRIKNVDTVSLVSRWISGELDDSDDATLDEIFTKSNGHFVLELLYYDVGYLLEDEELSTFDVKEKRQNKMIMNILYSVDRKTLSDVQTINPVNDYAKFIINTAND